MAYGDLNHDAASVITRNLDVTVAKPTGEYRGSARFSDGLVSIQDYVPFRADMDTTFNWSAR